MGDLLYIHRGADLSRSGLKKFSGGNVRYIKAKTDNNGIDSMVSVKEHGDLAITIVDVGIRGATYLQDRPFYASGNNTYATFKHTVNTRNKLLFIGSVINKRFKHLQDTYGRLGVKTLQSTSVLLPALEDGSPDYDYMEEYIRVQQGRVKERLDALESMI